ncbi:hypothetical protein CYMTET_35146 [Cymbomonas tetramitiformis]|uniref:Uncharacterized protein n=1 Tax=Cymbomonas tetramitiformis TaxID=36881 RepID=A0AAE0FA73_9CHLO|nr:hypothetical protein CYMTET_35146 [Cymbomonas tetramitiformis]
MLGDVVGPAVSSAVGDGAGGGDDGGGGDEGGGEMMGVEVMKEVGEVMEQVDSDLQHRHSRQFVSADCKPPTPCRALLQSSTVPLQGPEAHTEAHVAQLQGPNVHTLHASNKYLQICDVWSLEVEKLTLNRAL